MEKSYADIRLSINTNNTDLLMQTIALDKRQDDGELKREAVFYAIDCDKPKILEKIFSQYRNSANFTNRFTGKGDSRRITGLISGKGNSNCNPLVYAILLKKWNCASVIADSLIKLPLDRREGWNILVNLDKQLVSSNNYAFHEAKENKQYELIRLLLDAGVDINLHGLIEYGLQQEDRKLIRIGLIYGANYDTNCVKNEIFASEWQGYREGFSLFFKFCMLVWGKTQCEFGDILFTLFEVVGCNNGICADNFNKPINNTLTFFANAEENKQKAKVQREEEERIAIAQNRIEDIKVFLNDYPYISVTAIVVKALDMSDMVNQLMSLLDDKKLEADKKVIEADNIILNFLKTSAKSAIHSWEAFDRQTRVLGLGEAWVWGWKQYKVLNADHKNFIEDVKRQQPIALQIAALFSAYADAPLLTNRSHIKLAADIAEYLSVNREKLDYQACREYIDDQLAQVNYEKGGTFAKVILKIKGMEEQAASEQNDSSQVSMSPMH